MKSRLTWLLTAALILASVAPLWQPAVSAAPRGGALAASTDTAASVAPSAAPVDIRVNAGGPDYTDTHGDLWLADKAYAPGSWGYTAGASFSDPSPVTGTTDPVLYQSQHFNPGQYRFDIGNGIYAVELRFAEIYVGYDTRDFTVKIEGATFLSSFSPIRYVGFRKALNTTFLVKVTDTQLVIEFSGTQPIVNALRVTGGPSGPGGNEIRLNAGGFDYRDAQGKLWLADQAFAQDTRGYLGAQSASFSTPTAIGQTSEQGLFQVSRYDMTGYSFKVDNGSYRVDLLLAELYASVNSPGARVFDVYAEGTRVLSDLDIFALAGNKYKAITQTFTVDVVDAQLDITFTKKAGVNPPSVNAIAVLPLDSTPPAGWANFSPTTWQSTQTPDVSVQVIDTGSGLDVTSAEYAFSSNGGTTYSPWFPASVSGTSGTTSTQTISVAAVPFNKDSATQNTVKFRIKDMSGNTGQSGAYTVQIDSGPPASTITSPAANAMVSGPAVTIQGTASDSGSGVQSVDVSTNGGASWSTASGTTSWSYSWAVPGDGVYNLRSRARDNRSFIETPGAGITVTVDSTPPVTVIRTPGNGQTITSTTYLITGTAYDATSGVQRVEVSFNNGVSWTNASGSTSWSYLWTPAGQGAYVIRARAVDKAGIVDNPGTAVNVIVDRVAPTSTISDPTPGRVIRGDTYVVSGTASDDASGSGLAQVQVSTDGSTWQNASGLATWTYNWDLPGDGAYTVRSRARDAAGNVQSPPASVSVTVDNTPPVSTHTFSGTSGSGGWYVSPATLSIVASDGTSGVRAVLYRLDSGDWMTYTAPVSITAQGSHEVAYYAIDNGGNSEPQHTATLRIDSVPPVATPSLSGTAGAADWYRSAVSFSLLVTDSTSGAAAARFSLDGGPWLAYSGPVQISAQGAHTVSFYATDAAGNDSAVDSIAFKIDSQAPLSVITFPTAGQAVSGGSIVIQGTASDGSGSGVSGVAISINGGAWVPTSGVGTWTYAWTPPGPGQHNLRVRATDVAGNVEDPGSGIYVTVDTSRPSSSIVTPTSGQFVQGPTVVITGTASDTYSSVALVEVSDNGGVSWAAAVLGAGSVTWSYQWTPAHDGAFTLVSRATDRAGNVELPGAGITVQVDSIAPQTQITSPVNGQSVRAASLVIAGTAADVGSGVHRVEISIDNGPWVVASGTLSWSYTWSPIGSDGVHTIRSRAVDNAGNVESPGASITVTVDNGAPSSTITQPLSGQVISDSFIQFTGTAFDAVSGVANVRLTIRRGIDGWYWNGGAWSPGVTWLSTDGPVASWSYTWSDLPIVGGITVVSRAEDNLGNVETPGDGVTFVISRGYSVALPIIINDFAQ